MSLRIDSKDKYIGGAGKGDAERPIDRKVFRDNLSKVKFGKTNGTLARKKGIRTTYIYS